MKRILLWFPQLILWTVVLVTGSIEGQASKPNLPQSAEARHVATALDHITVLEFSEPVRQAAAGSSAFNIEWRDNNVLIKPLKSSVSTNLFVWTASQRHAYELDPPGDVKNMVYAVDTPSVAKPAPEPRDDQLAAIVDTQLTQAFLSADDINHDNIKNEKGRVVVQIENVFQSKDSLYIRYTIRNLADSPYRILKPALSEIVPPQTTLSLPTLRHMQLDTHTVQRLGETKRTALVVLNAETRKQDLRSDEETQGVIMLRRQFATPAVIQIVFSDAGDRHVGATFVF